MRKPVLLFFAVLLAVSIFPAHAKVTRYLTGNAADVSPVLAGPAHDLGGGGTDVDAALQWIIDRSSTRVATSATTPPSSKDRRSRCSGSITSAQALANPYHNYATFTYDFFHWTNFQNTITDSHFVTRDRMGRLLAFLARQIKDGKATSALGVAVNEVTSVVVDRNGVATVLGDGPAYFVLADHAPEVCLSGSPLTYSNYKIWKVAANGTFNLQNRPSTGYYTRSVTNGVVSSNPY